MKSRMRVLGVLGLCLLAGPGVSQDDEPRKEAEAAQKDILGLMQGNGDARTIYRKYGVEPIMWGFKRKDKGGIGIPNFDAAGEAGAGRPNGIENQITILARKEQTQADLAKDAASLTRMAEITKTIGEIIGQRKLLPAQGKTQQDWDGYTRNMIESSQKLIETIKANDPKKVKVAALKLTQSCNECHGKFRDE